MSGRIPQSFIDELVARADVAEVIGARINLKKAGREHKALCPFHNEKTPSFTVSPDKGFYHCFGCGAHGTAIGFLMSYENLGFVEAVEALAETLGMEVPSDVASGHTGREAELYAVLAETDQIYRAALRDHASAIEYLQGRGIDGPTAARYAIGFAPDGWDTIRKALGGSEARMSLLVEAGLLIENEQGRRYDRFRNRIMFPIRDHRGRIIGFGGRILGAGEPKYLNSPETPVFHKGQALYGLYEARQAHGRGEEMLVVEGYLDVASLAQHGIEPAVATLGTATTTEHIRRLTRLAERVIFCFDGDRAGRAAAWRALETALPHGGGQVELKFLLLPEGEDPDSLVRSRGPDAFRRLMTDAAPLSEFLLGELKERVDLSSADGRSRLTALARPLLNRLPAGVYRELLVAQLGETVGLSTQRLESLLDTTGGDATRRVPATAPPERRSSLIRKAIALILHYPAAAAELEPMAGLSKVTQPGAELLRQLLEIVARNPQITTAGLLERFREHPEGRHLGRLAGAAPLDDEAAAPHVLSDNLRRIVESYHRQRLGALLARRSTLDDQEQQELKGLLRPPHEAGGEP